MKNSKPMTTKRIEWYKKEIQRLIQIDNQITKKIQLQFQQLESKKIGHER